ncbi:winged helix DNA-binding domain-containing protein, partial [Piedraia hortae CBS 480.64]
YAKLLYRCLMEAPGHALTLKELYEWMKVHSQKAKDPNNSGWKNSVRHNLSMNAAFERVPPSEVHGVKKGSLWRL